ncbi:MAG: pSer/pThr/pTyr-binding forkhead associated (FHA) protein/class 3 adenylate cyclase [Myxococcota bacterium]
MRIAPSCAPNEFRRYLVAQYSFRDRESLLECWLVKRWLRSRKKKTGSSGTSSAGIDLLVLEGVDTGQKFTIDADEVIIGRRLNEADLTGGVLLRDSTVSARQARILHERGNYTIEHLAEATNPTMVNGSSVQSAMLVPGTQIQIGRILLDVRSREGTPLLDFTQLYAPAVPLKHAKSTGTHFETELLEAATAEVRVNRSLASEDSAAEVGFLEVRESAGEDGTQCPPIRHAIRRGRTTLGRSSRCDIRFQDLGVSRNHAELVWEGRGLALYHKSGTNQTTVNGQEITTRMDLHTGDEIIFAGRVVAKLELTSAPAKATSSSVPPVRSADPNGLRAAMEKKVALEKQIAKDFLVNGSFMDVDVVNSMGMKTNIHEPERIIVSFERFRAYIAGIVAEFRGHLLNSNGDELMCFFESSHDAVRAGSAVFERLVDFNKNENVLDSDFSFRIGVHTGQSLVDLKRGIAYSTTLDVAGHLQKIAATNQMTISAQTLASLPEGLPFKWVGTLEREGFDYYHLEGKVE